MKRKRVSWAFLRRFLATAVAMGTASALTVPALTMEAPVCGREEHQHEDVCFTPDELLRCCGTPHSHGETCYDSEGRIACGFADYFLHSHDETCFDRTGLLKCPLPVFSAHIHDDSCWVVDETETPLLFCEQEEQLRHVHEEACFDQGKWVCGGFQLEEHVHTAGCFEIRSVLACTLTEHTHEEACFPVPQTTDETVTETTEETETAELPILLTTENPQSETQPLAAAAEGDIPTVTGDGIRFRLFNYSTDINKDASLAAWRPIAGYFTFRDSNAATGDTPSDTVIIPTNNANTQHDADGFTAAHATVERKLHNGLPVLDLTRNADGTTRTDPGVSAQVRSLAYLFSDSGDHAVTAYSPGNTILRKDGVHYWYNSRDNAVDYDETANLFRLRSYAERNSTTATYGSQYGDFLPFNHTGGQVLQEATDSTAQYHLLSADADYWFGMSMEVSFYQSKDGLLADEDMVFRFSGDDDVWVFVDDVLVLDLGGTHGTVDGSINFATGQILQYLSWRGANAAETARTEGSATSFPTTLRSCFDAAGATPNGGWDESGTTFADYTEHTLTFFYLERGAAVANCSIDFRLPTLPDKSLTVAKELTGDDDTQDFIRDSLSYRFRVLKADAQGNSTGELYLTPGMTYTLLENGAGIGTEAVTADGTFSLKAGQSAQFADMLVKGGGAKNYVVQEIMPDSLTGQYGSVEYLVSGAGGTTKTEEGPTEDFTAFETDALSAEQTQMVMFRNRVETSQLSRLRITKRRAEGSDFTGEEVFPIQVTLGGKLLETGSRYQVGEEIRSVASPGILWLKLEETAVLLQGILSGTQYEVTELPAEGKNYRPSYTGTVSPTGSVNCTANGASGTFPLNSTVEITVTNASYVFSAEIPISKQALDNEGTASFAFEIRRAQRQPDGGWTYGEALPGTTVTVRDGALTNGRILIGFDGETAGTHYFRVEEAPGTLSFRYDDTFYILEITAQEDSAAITGIWKNGTEALPEDTRLPFVNRRTTSVLITKTVVGGSREETFFFTATVTDGGETTITEFHLKHGQVFTLPNVPWGAEVAVEEAEHDHYIASWGREGLFGEETAGNRAVLTADREDITLRFRNRSAYELPQTGGSGTNLYTLGGLLQTAAAACLLYCQRKREKEERPSADTR